MRALIIVGNGLGMALDPQFFRLKMALGHVWHTSKKFKPEHKQLVISALRGTDDTEYPHSEDQLQDLQLAILASDFLRKFEGHQAVWLDANARQLPGAFKSYIHEVAMYFQNYDGVLPQEFADSIADFIRSSRSHLAVLNYDDLLYNALIQREILKGYSGTLIDGFWADGFSSEHLDRHSPAQKGWYMHLHGSPLFIDNLKIRAAQKPFVEPSELTHIVLTHVDHKTSIIEASPILSEYWKRLSKAVEESSQIFLFGYSGEDKHLNEGLCLRAKERRINIIEWSGAGSDVVRRQYWNAKLPGCNVKLIPLDNILNFTNWSYEMGV